LANETIPTQQELEQHHVAVDGDRPWQRRLRLLQATWREQQGLPLGRHGSGDSARPLGSRIAMPEAEQTLSNYLTKTIGEVVQEEVASARSGGADGKLISEPRIYEDLLSSQPLCFNLFGEMQRDLALATRWARHLWPARVKDVTRVAFEYSPGRRDERYLGNRTAFDVYLEHTVPGGGEGFVAIEVKYHESLAVPAADTRARIGEVARAAGCFAEQDLATLGAPPLQQVWFDHLLALSILQADAERWRGNGLFVFMHPVANEECYGVVAEYERHVQDRRSFQRMTLEEAAAALRVTSGAPWVEAFQRRYLDYGRG
jgi:hypothetical protein